MNATIDDVDDAVEYSREFEMVCDTGGVVVQRDARAARRTGIDVGSPLHTIAVPGTEAKLRSLLERGAARPALGVEASLLIEGKATTVAFNAVPAAHGRVRLFGCLLPDYDRSLRQMEDSVQDVVALNREVVAQKREIEQKKVDLEQALIELQDSNRGIATLHSELEDKAETLRRTADVKGRVVANVSHEFRTPLHTILGLTRLLLDGGDGPLSDEQRTQMQFIRQSAEELSSMVDDLLDLASAEAGRLVVRSEKFSAANLLSSLRGTVRPLLPTPSAIELTFNDAPADLALETDQGKVSQILRNLVSNALKFTEAGEVTVSIAQRLDDVLFTVTDTGIGIAPENFDLIFEEFGQIDGPLQERTKGTGLGLPLSRRLAELLGGVLTVTSEPGAGSTFTLRIPRVHPEARKLGEIQSRPLDPNRAPILVVEDDRKTIFIYEKYLSMAGYQVVPARTIADAERLLNTIQPAAIVLDIMLDGESSWNFLGRLKKQPATRDVPVLVVTVTNKEQKARALGADEFWLKPVDQDQLLRKLRSLKTKHAAHVLVIDDDSRARYLVSRFLDGGPYRLTEAATGAEGVAAARQHQPDVILLDFLLKGTTAFDVLDELKGDHLTRNIPVIIITSHTLDAQERQRLASQTEVILSKESLSRELAINRIRDALVKAGAPASLMLGKSAS